MREGDEARAAAETQDQEPAGRGARPSATALAAAVAVGVGFLVHLREWTFLCDDAFISFRYARNLGRHGALVYNLPPYEAVEGYTNLLWVLVLGLGEALGLASERLAPVLTAAASLASLLLVAVIGARLRRRFGPLREQAGEGPAEAAPFELVDLLAPALLVTVPEFVVWGSGGLETSFALCLGLCAVWLWLRGQIELAALAAAATGLARPDGLVAVAAFGLGWLAVVGLEQRGSLALAKIPWRRVGLAALLFAAPLLASLVFRRAYYGEWLPNTWAVKHHGAALREFYGVGYLRSWAARLHLAWLAPLVVLLRPRHLMLALPIAAQLWWAWSIGGDFMAYSRFLLPATTCVALLVGLALAEGRDELVRRRWLARPRATALWGALALVLVAASASRIPARIQEDRAHAHLHIDYEDPKKSPGFEGVDAMHRFAAIRYAAGLALARQVPEDTLITVGAAGALPYASGLPAYDSYGLVDPGVVEVATPRVEGARPGHQLHAPLAYMRSHEPDLMCHIGYAGERLPPPGWDRRMRAGRGWTGWACVETGPIPDRRAEGEVIPSHYYCCMRPRGRFDELDELALRGSK
jgi:arabinofuranosyltransferase